MVGVVSGQNVFQAQQNSARIDALFRLSKKPDVTVRARLNSAAITTDAGVDFRMQDMGDMFRR